MVIYRDTHIGKKQKCYIHECSSNLKIQTDFKMYYAVISTQSHLT